MLSWVLNCLIGLLEKKVPRNPKEKYDRNALDDWISGLSAADGQSDLSEEEMKAILSPAFSYIQSRYDCSDFWYLRLLQLQLMAPELCKKYPQITAELEKTITSFKFWITSKGKDSVCYYSENHQCVFCVCEYLAGQLYPEKIFSIDRKTGIEHQEIAKNRFLIWYNLRLKYGFSEFYSSNYLPINLGALSFLIEYAQDKEMVDKAKILCTEILKMYADATFEHTFVNASARDYPRNLINATEDEPNSNVIIETLLGNAPKALSYQHSTARYFAELVFKSKKYEIPKEITSRLHEKEVETTVTMGLDLKDYKKEGLFGVDNASLMMQLGSGALTNPEIIKNTVRMMGKFHLYHSDFLGWIRFLTVPSFYLLGLLPLWSKKMNFFQNGMALQKAEVYTYRNSFYKISCLQGYYPGSCGAQKNTMAVTLPGGVTIFTNHPLRNVTDSCDFKRSPSYFGGYGIAPIAYANNHIVRMEYRIPERKPSFAPCPMLSYTHTFFPTELFDEYEVNDNLAIVRVKGTYLAIAGKNPFTLRTCNEKVFQSLAGKLKNSALPYDLVQEGRDAYWVYELSSEEKESFEVFKNRILVKEKLRRQLYAT